MACNADEHLRDGKRIKNLTKFKQKVRLGSHLAQKRSSSSSCLSLGYYHHFLVVEDVQEKDNGVKIIHYAPAKPFGEVQEILLPFDKINFEEGVYLIWSNGYPTTKDEKERAISRARSRLGEDRYMAVINNCEHFVTWALTERPLSHQIKDANSLVKLGLDSFDGCLSKTNAASESFKIGTELSILGIKTISKKIGPVPKQLETQAQVLPMTPSSPLKTFSDTPIKELAIMTRTMPAEKLGLHDLPTMLLPQNIVSRSRKIAELTNECVVNPSKKLISDISKMSTKLEVKILSTIENVPRALATAAEKIGEDRFLKTVVDNAWISTAKTVNDITGNMVPNLGKKFVVDSLEKSVSDAARKYMIDLSAVQTAFGTAKNAIVEKTGKGAVEKAGTNSIQAVGNIAGTSSAEVQKVAVEKVTTKSVQEVGNIAGKSAAAAGKEAIKQAAKNAAKTSAIVTTFTETIGLAYDIYHLYKDKDNNIVSETDWKRGVCTKVSGAIGSIAGSAAGAYLGSTVGALLGQILIPVPGVGAWLGSTLFGLAGKALLSGASGFLFDRIMKL